MTTDLAAVRQAAEMCVALVGRQPITDYVLATIPPDPQAPITAEWLREVWGFRDDCCWESEDEDVEQSLVDTGCYKCVDPDGVIIWCEETGLTLGRDGHTETIVQFPITTRHQFAKLMTALGIEPKKGEVV